MDNGWISLHRKLLENPICRKPKWLSLWVVLLLLASHKEKDDLIWNGKPIHLKKGQFITGRKKLSEITSIAETTIEDILNCLETRQQIRQQKTTKFRLITILNWDKYQKVDNKATTKRQQSDTINKDNKDNKERTKERRKTSFSNLDSFLNSPQKHIRLIGRYAEIKGLQSQFSTPEQWTVFGKRWLKDAASITKFDEVKTKLAFEKAMEFPQWTLHTVYLKLTGQNL